MTEISLTVVGALAASFLILFIVLILSIRKVRRILMVAEEKANAPIHMHPTGGPITSDLNRPAPSDRNVGHDWSPAYKACRNCNMPRAEFLVSFAACPGDVEEKESLVPFLERGPILSMKERRESRPTISLMDPDRVAAIKNGSHYWKHYLEERDKPIVMRCNICGMFERDWILHLGRTPRPVSRISTAPSARPTIRIRSGSASTLNVIGQYRSRPETRRARSYRRSVLGDAAGTSPSTRSASTGLASRII